MDNRPKLIVLPLLPDADQEYNGTGFGVHFLLGNMVAIHPKLAECWFGWRANKIFKTVSELDSFCRNKDDIDVNHTAKEQKIRFWLYGKYKQKKNIILVSLTLFDSDGEKKYSNDFCLDPSDFFVGFADAFFHWLVQCNLPLDNDQILKARWKEKISIKGLDFLGRAVKTTYENYIEPSLFKDGLFDLKWFEKAVIESPLSYLTHDMKGWAFYKNRVYENSKDSFKKALENNKDGIGALAGLMWCYVFEKNKKNALKYAIAKADVKKDPHETAIKFIEKKFLPE